MKHLFLSLLMSTFLIFNVIAQQKEPVMNFSILKHDFGSIKQEDGLAKYKFEFTNTGGAPITISNVATSCGCTTPSWSKQPIAPGQKGYVEAAYDPKNRPGHFSKTITVHSNAQNTPIVLTITGNVTEKQNTIEEKYPQEVGILRVDQIYLNYGNIFNDETKEMELKIYNPTEQDVTISVEDNYRPAYTTISIEPTVLKPKQEGVIKVSYDGSKVNDWDYVRGYLYLTINGQRITDKRIQVSSIIKEKFSAEQLLNPPVIDFETTSFEFDTVPEGEVVIHEFTFTNTGKSDLIIRKTRSSCGCTAVSLSNKPIKPGESSSIKLNFNTSHKPNYQTKTVTVITNCPDEKLNKIILKLSGFVKPKQQ